MEKQTEQTKPILLRPHHGLCIGFFRGKGYSAEFVRNMTTVIARLNAEDPLLELHCGADVICAACPNLLEGVCRSAEQVFRYDSGVLQLIGAREGDVMHWSQLRAAAEEQILQQNKRAEVCGDCQWSQICR